MLCAWNLLSPGLSRPAGPEKRGRSASRTRCLRSRAFDVKTLSRNLDPMVRRYSFLPAELRRPVLDHDERRGTLADGFQKIEPIAVRRRCDAADRLGNLEQNVRLSG